MPQQVLNLPNFRATWSNHSDHSLVELQGELDAGCYPDFEQFLYTNLKEAGKPIVIDLGLVTFMDNAGGIRSLLRLPAFSSCAKKCAVLARPQPLVRRMIEMIGLHKRLPVTTNVADAIAILGTHCRTAN